MAKTRGSGEHRNSLMAMDLGDKIESMAFANRLKYERDTYMLELWAKNGFVSVPGQTIGAMSYDSGF